MCWDQTVVNKLYKQASSLSVQVSVLLGGGEGSQTSAVLSSSFGVHPASHPFLEAEALSTNWSDASEALLTWCPPGR